VAARDVGALGRKRSSGTPKSVARIGPILLKRGVMRSSSKARPKQPKRESTVRYLGIEVDDALEMAEQTEV